jgi:hypothetical protein
LAWRFDESIAKPMQDLESIGMINSDVAALTQAFLVCGFWRAALNEGLFFFTDHMFKIFEIEPYDGPVNIGTIVQIVHPDDRVMVLDAFQRSVETQQTYHCIYRLILTNGNVKWVRSVGNHHIGPNGEPEVRGMTHELFQHIATVAFMVDPAP